MPETGPTPATVPDPDTATDAAPAPSWQPSEGTRRHFMARAHLDSIVLHLVREFEDPTAITNDLDLDQLWRRPEAEPLAAIRATLAIRNAAATLLHEHIGRARGAGHTWADLAVVLDVEKAADEARLLVGEAAFNWVTTGHIDDPRQRWRDYPTLRWTCATCGQRITDHGPVDPHPGDMERGHASDCERHRAALSAWDAETETW
jgi:hypothetical protein